MAREDRFTTTPEDAAAWAHAHAQEADDDRPSMGDLLDDGIGGNWELDRSESEWAAAAHDLWGAIVPQDEPPF
jgi:hypothetical protein